MKNIMRNLFFIVSVSTVVALVWFGCSDSDSENGGTTYTVTFDSQGGSAVESQKIVWGKGILLPMPPTRQNHFFRGWYKEATCANLWNFNTDVIEGDTVLFAKWESKAKTNDILWGVNIHDGGDNPQNMANKLSERNLKCVRMDYWGSDDGYVVKFRNAVSAMNSKGITAQAIVFSVFSKGQPRSTDYDADLVEVEETAYKDVKLQVEKIKDVVSVYELQNEIPYYDNMNKEGTTGENASDYDTPAGRLQAAVLRGMSKAINDIRGSSASDLRIILGTVDRRFGFLRYMQEQGVLFDIVGYHIYPWEDHAALDQDAWFGEGGPIGQLARFDKPIHINEFNCGEIYSGDPDYENEIGKPLTEKGFRSLNKHLTTIANQKVANIEAVILYEVADEPHKHAPENRFGLYFDVELQNPKVSLLIATAFAGGYLSDNEKGLLEERGFTYYKE